LVDQQKLIAVAEGDASTSYERRNAIAALGEFDDLLTLKTLVQLLSVEDRYLRLDVVKAIGTHGSDSAVLALINCLRDETDNVRRDAASLLANRNDGRAIPALRQLLDDKGYAVRHAAEAAVELLEREGVEPVDVEPALLESFLPETIQKNSVSETAPEDGDAAVGASDATHDASEPGEAQISGLEDSKADVSSEHAGQDSVTPNDATRTGELGSDPLDHGTGKVDSNKTVAGKSQAAPTASESLQRVADDPGKSTPKAKNEQGFATTQSDAASDPTRVVVDNAGKAGEGMSTRDTANSSDTRQSADQDEDSESNVFGAGIEKEQTSEEEVLLAEIVQTPVGNEPALESSALGTYEQALDGVSWEKMVLPTPPDHFQWANAKRFVSFFGEELDHVKNLYDELGKRQADVLAADIAMEKAILQHDLVHADLADDLEATQKLQRVEGTAVSDLQQEATSLAAILASTRRGSSGFLSSLANSFWPTRLKALNTLERNLNLKMREIESGVKSSKQKLTKAAQHEKNLSKPLKDVDQGLLTASEVSTKANHDLSLVRTGINEAILRVVNLEPKTEANLRIDGLMGHCSNAGVLRQCVQEIHQLQAEQKVLMDEMLALESPLNEDARKFAKSTNDVANAVTNGFVHRSRDRKLKTEVNCTVAFRSASTSTGATHRLIGKAEGQANLSADYKIDQIEWNGGQEVREAIDSLNTSATRVGSLQALHAIRAAEIAASSSSLNDCISFIRIELEQDFGGSR